MVSGLGFDGFPPKARWTALKFADKFRPKHQYDFYVTGNGHFPVDMLRYDQCWPVEGDERMFQDAYGGPNRSIKMRSHKEPTIERWSSFGWSVGTEKLDG